MRKQPLFDIYALKESVTIDTCSAISEEDIATYYIQIQTPITRQTSRSLRISREEQPDLSKEITSRPAASQPC